jgi:hypothetical protein
MANGHATDTSAEPRDPVGKPQNWDIVVSVAYLRLTGATQAVAAEGAGCSERSVVEWEKCSWWADAEREAQGRWLRGIDSRARVALERAFSDPEQSANTARWWADRRVPELAPPKVRQEHDVSLGFAERLDAALKRSKGGL